MLNFTKTTLQKLEMIFKEQDYTIRYEKETFKVVIVLSKIIKF